MDGLRGQRRRRLGRSSPRQRARIRGLEILGGLSEICGQRTRGVHTSCGACRLHRRTTRLRRSGSGSGSRVRARLWRRAGGRCSRRRRSSGLRTGTASSSTALPASPSASPRSSSSTLCLLLLLLLFGICLQISRQLIESIVAPPIWRRIGFLHRGHESSTTTTASPTTSSSSTSSRAVVVQIEPTSLRHEGWIVDAIVHGEQIVTHSRG